MKNRISEFEKFENDIKFMVVDAKKPLIWLDTYDYNYAVDIVTKIKKDKERVIIYNNATKLVCNLNSDNSDTPLTKKVNQLGFVIKNFLKGEDIFIGKNLLIARISEAMFDETNDSPSDRLVSYLQDFVYQNNRKKDEDKKTILLIAATHFDIVGLEHLCERLTLPLPDKDDIQNMFGYFIIRDEEGRKKELEGKGNEEYPFAPDFTGRKFDEKYEKFIEALHGMSRYDIQQTLYAIKSKSGKKNRINYLISDGQRDEKTGKYKECTIIEKIKEVKKQLVRNSGLLEIVDYEEDFHKEVADIENLTEYLEKQKRLIENQLFLSSDLPRPKGILLVGAPGCGKSASAKAAASILRLPLYRLNIGDLLGHKYGQSENQFNEALRTAESSAPCVLWIDEIEKAFAGTGNGQNDNDDVLMHIMGRFLTWMQDHKTLVYLVATANDISEKNLKPEFLREGRWDEKFYLVYPSEEGRKKILNARLEKYGLLKKYGVKEIDCSKGNFIEKMEKMSGAAIEKMVVSIAIQDFDPEDVQKPNMALEDRIDKYLQHYEDQKDTTTFDKYQKEKDNYKNQGCRPASKNEK